jgi:hypothetical protein
MTAARHRRRRPEQRPRYALIIEGRGGGSDIHALRALLKQLLRRYHFRALDVREETEPERPSTQTMNLSAWPITAIGERGNLIRREQ